MAEPYIGEIRMFAGDYAPAGWLLCHGQVLPIAEYIALFQLIGTTYGGNGVSTFALPDLRGRVPVHFAGWYQLGEIAGVEQVTLAASQLPPHTHGVPASSQPAAAGTPKSNVVAATTGATRIYAFAAGAPSVTLAPEAVAAVGAGQPHENRMPFLAINFIIATDGLFPSQD